MNLLDKAETPRLGFDSFNGVRDFASDSVEFFHDGLAPYDSRLVEGYEEFEFDLVLSVRIGTRRKVYDLLFNPIPGGVFGDCHSGESNTALNLCGGPLKVGSEWGEHGVIVGISKRVQRAEKVVPSVVRLERT